MEYRDYQVVIIEDPEAGGYYAFVPALPGCVTQGETIEETRDNLREVIALFVGMMREHGEAVPDIKRNLVSIEEVELSLPA